MYGYEPEPDEIDVRRRRLARTYLRCVAAGQPIGDWLRVANGYCPVTGRWYGACRCGIHRCRCGRRLLGLVDYGVRDATCPCGLSHPGGAP